MSLHRFLQQFQRCLAISRFGDDAFQHLAFVIHLPPELVPHPIDLYKNLVQVPAPLRLRPHALHPLVPDFCRKYRTKPVPPVPHGYMADFNPAFVQQILNVAQRQREPDIQHYRQADDLKASLQVTESGLFGHPGRIAKRNDRLKLNCSDTAPQPLLR
jgi:hypothetical protein